MAPPVSSDRAAFEEKEMLPPLQATPTKPSRLKQKRISFNPWRQSEVIPAVNRVSLQVTAEERRKLESYDEETVRLMWNPDSQMRLSWDLIIALVTVFLAWRLPYSLAFENDPNFEEQTWSSAFNSIANVIYILDIVANFRTGYRSDIEVTWFLIDLAGSIPFEQFVQSGDSGIERKAVKTSLKYLKIPKLFRLARVIRFVRKYMQYMYTIQLSILYVSIVHWVACLSPYILSVEVIAPDPFSRYGGYLYIAVTAMFNLGQIDDVPPDECIILAALSVLGYFLLCLVSSSITAIFVSQSSRASEYQDKIRAVMTDLKALQVPRELRVAAKNYYEMLWRVKKTSDRYEKFIYEDQDLSPTIRAEIALHIHRRAIAVVPLFKGCTDDCLATVVMKLRTHLYMADDVIFHKGEPGRSMLIIIRGKVKIIGGDNRSLVAVLKEGSFFGEIGLLQNTARSCTVVAATFCEMKSLEQADAEYIFSLYPHILERLYRESDRRKRDNTTKSSIGQIRVLDNAHVVGKESIDHLQDASTRSLRDSKSPPAQHHHLPVGKSSLIEKLDDTQSWIDRTQSISSSDANSKTIEALANLRMDVDDLRDMLTTILDNQKLLVEKLSEIESRPNYHAHRRRTKDASGDSGPKKLNERSASRRRELLSMAGESDRSLKFNGSGSNATDEEHSIVVNRLMQEPTHKL
ncbi:hypothetical protein LEN26_016486 [Aphanomyces euteiches]|nr:hypothetical protein LEN26_016486 [Aphanomyces euteiches]KAH9188001.1 hypothetical protein AeNC1_010026 [Aphanomyces euteiches]